MANPAAISFVLDGAIHRIDFTERTELRPTTTVLQYLRSLPDRKGTKEGCAEGDCGACTVVLARLNAHGELEYRAFDSCLIFLPMIDGSQLITVESIGSSTHLHPVQQAMVDHDGSQCGYCTPGFIMSLFSIYKNIKRPTRAEIDDCLTGNLCRCTGYRSIVKAAAEACVSDGADQLTTSEPEVKDQLLELMQKASSIHIQSDEQEYFRPASLDEALSLRSRYPNAHVINGATDIALLVTKRNRVLEKIIDLSAIDDLKAIDESPTNITYGAGTSLEDVKAHCKAVLPALYDCLEVFGSVQIRNLATLGGNIGSASPIGDTPVMLMAFDASVVLASVDGKRMMKLSEFITGYRETSIKQIELITKIIVPKPDQEVRVKWYKISKRKDLDISTISAGFRLELNEDETVRSIQLYYGGMAAMIKNADATTEFLVGKAWERSVVEEAMRCIEQDFTPISDARSGAAGRMVMARNLLLKFWNETTAFDVIKEL